MIPPTANTRNSEGGYIALISAIIVGAILLLITFSLSFAGFFSRFDTLSDEFKDETVALAEACGDTALLDIADGAVIATPLAIPVANGTCTIYSVQAGSPMAGETTILTQASSSGIVTNMKIVASSTDASIVSWEEIPTSTVAGF